MEDAALPDLALDPDPAPMSLNKALGDIEAETGAPLITRGLPEAQEDSIEHVLRYSRAGVLYVKFGRYFA